MSNLIILRGVPGSGKSTLAKLLVGNGWDAKICEADNYFVGEDGVYRFDHTKLGAAHEWCRNQCEGAMKAGVSLIVLSNTNVRPKDFKAYEDLAELYNYRVTHLIVENRHGGSSVHGVPAETLTRMTDSLRSTIQL
jgi:predicted kinase